MGFAVTGLTPFCGSAHARNGRGYKQIEAVNATVLPRGALRKFHACSAEIEKPVSCTHLTLPTKA